MSTRYAETTGYEPQAPQTCRHVDLRGSVRRAPADVEGKSGDFCGHARRNVWNSPDDALQLGVKHQSTAYRATPEISRISRCFGANSNAQRIISKKYPKIGIPPYCNIPKLGYNGGITKDGIARNGNFLLPLVTNLNDLDQLLALNYSRTLYLASDSSQPTKGDLS